MGLYDTSGIQVSYVPEEIWGITPGTPAFQRLRVTGFELVPDRQTATSQEIRPDYQSAGPIETGMRVAGTINGELTYGTFDSLWAALMFGDWSSNVLVNGLLAPTSFTFEKKWTGATPLYQRFRGMMIDTAEFTFSPGEIAKFTLGVRGMEESTPATTAITGSTYAAAPSGAPMNTTSGISGITEGGAALTGVREIKLSYGNNLRDRPALGTRSGLQPGRGTIGVTGNITIYAQDTTLYTKGLAFTESSLGWTISDGDSGCIFGLPALKYTNPRLVAPGVNQDGLVAMDFEAFGGSEGHTASLTRVP